VPCASCLHALARYIFRTNLEITVVKCILQVKNHTCYLSKLNLLTVPNMPKSNYFVEKNEIASLGASLRRIEQKILKHNKKGDISRVWFQGEEPYFDIFFEFQNDQIAWFQFTLRGRSLSWDSKIPGWQTGNTNELKMDDVSFYAASKTIENDTKIDVELINLVKLILETRAEETIFAQALALFN
jgi:hypothetical protein